MEEVEAENEEGEDVVQGREEDFDEVDVEIFEGGDDGNDDDLVEDDVEDFDKVDDCREGEFVTGGDDVVAVEILEGDMADSGDVAVALTGEGGWAAAAAVVSLDDDFDLDLEKKNELDRLGCEEFLGEEDEAEAPTDLAFSRYRLYRSSMARISSSFLDNWSRSSATVSALDDNCVSSSSICDPFFLSSFSTDDVFCMASVSWRRICELA